MSEQKQIPTIAEAIKDFQMCTEEQLHIEVKKLITMHLEAQKQAIIDYGVLDLDMNTGYTYLNERKLHEAYPLENVK